MRNKILFSALLAFLAILAVAFIPKDKNLQIEANSNPEAEPGIRFIEADWNKALAEAKKQHKLIFLDAYASWCGPCKLLKKKTFPDKEAGEFFNANYINVAIDMEKGDGPTVAQLYNVNAYPTLIIADGDGNMVTYTKGYIDAKQLIEFGKHGLSKK